MEGRRRGGALAGGKGEVRMEGKELDLRERSAGGEGGTGHRRQQEEGEGEGTRAARSR